MTSMQREECIYNLIPKVQPTGTTFGVHGTTKLEGANLGAAPTKMMKQASARDFGRLGMKPDPQSFIRKGERSAAVAGIAKKPTSKFTYSGPTRPSVVKQHDKPIMGLKSAKNFVTANAVEAIVAKPGKRAHVKNEPPRYRNKEDYGQVPRYLNQVKHEIERENAMIEEFVRQSQEIKDEHGNHVEPMDETERLALVDALKAKWDHVNAKYQQLCHNVVFDTLGKVRRKETYEKELTQLEKDIQLLEKGHLVVSGNNHNNNNNSI